MMHLNKILFVVRGGPPQHKDGSSGVGSGNYPRVDSGYVDFSNTAIGSDNVQEQLTKYFNEKYQPWYDTLTHDQISAVDAYSRDDYADINSVLRTGSLFPDKSPATDISSVNRVKNVRLLTKRLYSAMTPIDEPLVVYRGVSAKPLSFKDGSIFRDRGFVSTSIEQSIANDNGHILRIKLPAGTKVAYGNYDGKGEKEIILAPNTSFKVLGHTPGMFMGRNTVELEVVPTKKSYNPTVERKYDAVKKSLVVRGGKPQHKDGTEGIGSGNYPHEKHGGAIDFGLLKDEKPLFQETQAEKYHANLREQWLGNITTDQYDSVRNYSGAPNSDMQLTNYVINDWLRRVGNKRPLNPRYANQIVKTVKNIYNSMTPLSEDTYVYRGVANSFNPPPAFREKGFTSTSLRPEVAKGFGTGFNTLRIKIPKGTRVAYGLMKGEQEIIVHPNAQFKTLGQSEDGNYTDIEYVPHVRR